MAVEKSGLVDKEQIQQAADNYIDCLNLPAGSQVVMVTDKLARELNGAVRLDMADRISGKLLVGGYRVEAVMLDHGMSREEMYAKTEAVLIQLNAANDVATTVIYMGDAWDNRGGMYDAVNDFGEGRDVRVAGSLGFSAGDCRVMSKLSSEKRETIKAASEYFEEFFEAHPRGKFSVITSDAMGEQYSLELDYDVSQVPFHVDMGAFDEEHAVMLGNFKYVNIPGGETFSSPYPFRQTAGSFAAEGVVFEVKSGVIVGAKAQEGAIKEPSQRLLLKLVSEGKSIPVVELGLGFYALAGITTFEDSSVLSREKGGPHIGMGTASWKTPEAAEMEKLAQGFHHTDFVMDSPRIMWSGKGIGEEMLFYPPATM